VLNTINQANQLMIVLFFLQFFDEIKIEDPRVFDLCTKIVAVSFIGGGNQCTQRKPMTCSKSLTNFIT
jgi:hypothetical protein